MADLMITQFSAIVAIADDDVFVIDDISATETKKVSYGQLKGFLASEFAAAIAIPDNQIAYGNAAGDGIESVDEFYYQQDNEFFLGINDGNTPVGEAFIGIYISNDTFIFGDAVDGNYIKWVKADETLFIGAGANGDVFEVNASGDILIGTTDSPAQIALRDGGIIEMSSQLTIATVPYVFPGADAAGSLTSDGAGNLSWVAITGFSNELVDDRVAALIQNGTGITWSYNDLANTLTPTVTITQYTNEDAQDAVGGILTDSGTIDFTYDDGANTITAIVKDDSITYGKIQNVSATDRLLGRVSASAGDIEEIPITDFVQSILDDSDAATVRATLGLTINTNVLGMNPESFIYYYSDFTFAMNNSVDTWVSNNSTGAGANVQSAAGTGNHCGIVVLRTGTTATGSTSYMSAIDAIEPAQGELTFEAVIRIPNVSDGTETFSARIGFIDSVGAESTDGAFFRYTHSVNSGKFEIVTRKAGAETAADSGITMTAGQWYKLKVVINAGATSVAFSIDGSATSNSPITTNIPNTSANLFGFGMMILKSAGLSQRTLQADYYKFIHVLTTPR